MRDWLIAAAAGLLAAAVAYARTAGGARRLAPAGLRALAVALLVALLRDAAIGSASPPRPVVALDASESWRRGAGEAPWRQAVARARALGGDSVVLAGDSARVGAPPPVPADRASRLGEVVERAAALGRPLVIVTDGEADDGGALARLPAGSRIEVVARPSRADVAVAALDLPRAAVGGDTLRARVTLAAGSAGAAAARVRIALDGRAPVEAAVPALTAFAEHALELRLVLPADSGARLVRAIVVPGGDDAEPRNDTLVAALELSAAAGLVFVSTAPDLDARHALEVARGALALPTRGFLRVAPGQWRREGPLTPVAEAEVRRALRDAPIAVLHGDTALFGPPLAATRGGLLLAAPPPAADSGEWFASAAPPSPVSSALAGTAWDSLPPLQVAARLPSGDWTALEARLGRQGAARPVASGRDGARRVAVVGAAGTWRWRARGGSAAGAHAALWGGLVDWIAGSRADRRAATPAASVIRAGEPVRWRRGTGDDSLVAVSLVRRGGAAGADTVRLRFGAGASLAESAPLAEGVYDGTVAGGRLLLAVNPSAEWLPRRPTVRAGELAGGATAGARRGLRDMGWPFVVAVLLLAAEWVVRRRLGMR